MVPSTKFVRSRSDEGLSLPVRIAESRLDLKAIIVGAGRGLRMMPETHEIPKSMLALFNGRRVLDLMLEALGDAGINDVVYVGGYQIERIRVAFPRLRLKENRSWATTNILLSLMAAGADLDDDLIVSYSDIFYRYSAVRNVINSTGDIALAVDPCWRESYSDRTQHPECEAEKVIIHDGRIVKIGKHLPSGHAQAEFIGLAKLSRQTARAVLRWWDKLESHALDRPFQHATMLRTAYLTDLFQSLIDEGFCVDPVAVEGTWFEIDTPEDLVSTGTRSIESFARWLKCVIFEFVEFNRALRFLMTTSLRLTPRKKHQTLVPLKLPDAACFTTSHLSPR